MRIILVIIFSALFIAVKAQQNLSENYVPLVCDSSIYKQNLDLTKSRYESDLITLKDKSKSQRLELTNLYTSRYNHVVSCYEENLIYTDTFVVNYFQRMLKVILDANPQLPNDLRLVIARNPWPNASCYGEGTIMFHLELVRWMENESQLAYVLCHEISHQYADHQNVDFSNYVAAINDPEYQKKLKQIYYSEYNTFEQALDLLKSYAYNDRKHSRLHEGNADSLAIVLMRNTPYSELEALSALAIMDKMDDEVFDTVNWRTIFNFPTYPFKESWLMKESGLSSFGSGKVKDIGELDSDSLKTHPDCKVRIDILQNQVQSGPNKKHFVQSPSDFQLIKDYSKFELVRNVYFYGNYGKTMFLAMELLKEYPNNAYLHGVIGKCWLEIYRAQERHILGKYVGLAGASDVYSYNELLIILSNLRLSELGKVAYNFLIEYKAVAANNEDLLYSIMQFSKIEGSIEDYVSMQNLYKRKYPDGKYISKL